MYDQNTIENSLNNSDSNKDSYFKRLKGIETSNTTENDNSTLTGNYFKVIARIRDLIPLEREQGYQSVIEEFDDNKIGISDEKYYQFDKVFGKTSTQADIFNKNILQMLQMFFCGYNCTVFAYGHTSSGKSYTLGTLSDFDYLSSNRLAAKAEYQGIVPRVLSAICQKISYDRSVKCTTHYEAVVSFVEIYNDEINDLFSNKTGKKKIKQLNGAAYVTGIKYLKLEDEAQVLNCVEAGCLKRTTRETNLNNTSSRSHAILSIYVTQKRSLKDTLKTMDIQQDLEDECETTSSVFQLVDLAGSERNKKSQAKGLAFREAISINTELFYLGNIICILSDERLKNSPYQYIPFKNSKLTRILENSIGSNALTLMITCISSCSNYYSETLNTLLFAQKATLITNKPVVNLDPKSKIILELKHKLTSLTAQLACPEKSHSYVSSPNYVQDLLISYLDAFSRDYFLKHHNIDEAQFEQVATLIEQVKTYVRNSSLSSGESDLDQGRLLTDRYEHTNAKQETESENLNCQLIPELNINLKDGKASEQVPYVNGNLRDQPDPQIDTADATQWGPSQNKLELENAQLKAKVGRLEGQYAKMVAQFNALLNSNLTSNSEQKSAQSGSVHIGDLDPSREQLHPHPEANKLLPTNFNEQIKILSSNFVNSVNSVEDRYSGTYNFSKSMCQSSQQYADLEDCDGFSLINNISISTIRQQTCQDSEDYKEIQDFKSDLNELDIAQFSEEMPESSHGDEAPSEQGDIHFNLDLQVATASQKSLLAILADINDNIRLKQTLLKDMRESERYFDNFQDKIGLLEKEIRSLSFTYGKPPKCKNNSADKQISTGVITSPIRTKLRSIFKPREMSEQPKNMQTGTMGSVTRTPTKQKASSKAKGQRRQLSTLKEVMVDKTKQDELVDELRMLKKIKAELTLKIRNEAALNKQQAKLKDKEIQALNTQLTDSRRKATQSEQQVRAQQDALRERRTQVQEIKSALTKNLNLVQQTTKLTDTLGKSLVVGNNSKVSTIYSRLSKDIQQLSERKASLIKYQRELESKDKVLTQREKVICRKMNLKKRAKTLGDEMATCRTEIEKKLNSHRSDLRDYEHKLLNAQLDERRDLQSKIVETRRIQTELEDDLEKRETILRSETSEVASKIEECDAQLKGYALDLHKKDVALEQYLLESSSDGGLVALDHVDSLNELEAKLQLKLNLIRVANLISSAKVTEDELTTLRDRLLHRDLAVKSLEDKHTSLLLQVDREKSYLTMQYEAKLRHAKHVLNDLFTGKIGSSSLPTASIGQIDRKPSSADSALNQRSNFELNEKESYLLNVSEDQKEDSQSTEKTSERTKLQSILIDHNSTDHAEQVYSTPKQQYASPFQDDFKPFSRQLDSFVFNERKANGIPPNPSAKIVKIQDKKATIFTKIDSIKKELKELKASTDRKPHIPNESIPLDTSKLNSSFNDFSNSSSGGVYSNMLSKKLNLNRVKEMSDNKNLSIKSKNLSKSIQLNKSSELSSESVKNKDLNQNSNSDLAHLSSVQKIAKSIEKIQDNSNRKQDSIEVKNHRSNTQLSYKLDNSSNDEENNNCKFAMRAKRFLKSLGSGKLHSRHAQSGQNINVNGLLRKDYRCSRTHRIPINQNSSDSNSSSRSRELIKSMSTDALTGSFNSGEKTEKPQSKIAIIEESKSQNGVIKAHELFIDLNKVKNEYKNFKYKKGLK